MLRLTRHDSVREIALLRIIAPCFPESRHHQTRMQLIKIRMYLPKDYEATDRDILYTHNSEYFPNSIRLVQTYNQLYYKPHQ